MSKENAHIESYLNYYCSLERSPGFAIMLTGKSGVGKTSFMNQFRKKLAENGKKTLLISLFGLKSFEEVESAFFEQLHPDFSKAGLGLSAKILKDSIKSTINLEIKKNQFSGEKNRESLVPEYLANANEYILIIDDIDRCFISTPEVFGYFSYLLEHHEFKIILIANEDSLRDRQDNQHIEELVYQRVKDKVVNRSFEIQPDFEATFQRASDFIYNKEVYKFLAKQKDLIRELFGNLAAANLRNLKHSLIDFERLYECLPEKSLSNHEFLTRLLTVFMIFSLEIRSNNVHTIDLNGIRHKHHLQLFGKLVFDAQKSPQTYLLEKYRKFNPQDMIFSEKWWVSFFESGQTNKDEIERELIFCRFFFDEHTPGLYQLTEFWKLSDKDFQFLLRKIQIEYSGRKYNETGAIKLLLSFLLWCSENKLLERTRAEILAEAKKYTEICFKNNSLIFTPTLGESEQALLSWKGIPFPAFDIPELKEFQNFIDELTSKNSQDLLASQASSFIELLKTHPEKFALMLDSSISGSEYHRLSVFNHIEPEEFFKNFLALSPAFKVMVAESLRARYFRARTNRDLLNESSWLLRLIQVFKTHLKLLSGSLSFFSMHAIIEKFLEPSLECLETLQMERLE